MALLLVRYFRWIWGLIAMFCGRRSVPCPSSRRPVRSGAAVETLLFVLGSICITIFFLTYDFDAGDDEAPDIPISYRYARGVRTGRRYE